MGACKQVLTAAFCFLGAVAFAGKGVDVSRGADQQHLPGFFRKAAAGTRPAKTLIMIGGGETFAEDLFFYIAPQTHDRGYHFMTLDLPGQGLLPLQGKTFRRDMNVPMKAVVDYALSRPEVDPQRQWRDQGGGSELQAHPSMSQVR